jgi:calcineurin-like phosphoesterase family protein
MARYFIADNHFYHPEIITICGRPFVNCDAMHECMIRYWNDTVKENDEVYVVGDFATATLEEIRDVLKQLNGKKYLVLGNHDTHTIAEYYMIGFDKVYDCPIILDGFWIVSHEPMFMNNSIPYVNIFGHVHNSPLYYDYGKKHFCVCAERIGYKPISFATIRETIGKEYCK